MYPNEASRPQTGPTNRCTRDIHHSISPRCSKIQVRGIAHCHPFINGSRLTRKLNGLSWPKVPESDIQQTQQWIEGKIFKNADGSGALNRKFQFVMVRADDPAQRIIGTVGINSLTPAPSIGYGLHPEFWGKGYSSEAAQGVINAWWQLPRVKPDCHLNGAGGDGKKEMLYACCNSENVGSMNVLEKNGFQLYDKVPLEGDLVAYWRRECQMGPQ